MITCSMVKYNYILIILFLWLDTFSFYSQYFKYKFICRILKRDLIDIVIVVVQMVVSHVLHTGVELDIERAV